MPYQRRRLDEAGLRPGDVDTLEDLRRLLPVGRADVAEQPPRDLVTRGLDPDRMPFILTSGSTAEPLRIRRTIAGKRVQGLLRQRLLWRAGVRPRDHLVRLVYVRPRRRGEGRIAAAFERLGLFRVSSVSCLELAPVMAAEIARLRPDVLTGFPSALAEVAAVVQDDPGRIAPRLVLTGGEVIEPHVRRRLERAFGAPVRDVYSCYEAGILAWECATTGHLHVHGEGVFLEVLDRGRPVEPGAEGEIVVTNLHGFAMPFLRYRLGDLATHGAEGCACGAPYPTLRAVQGRVVDLFPLPDGRVLHPYAMTNTFLPVWDVWIRRFQLEQEQEDAVRLRLVLAPGAPDQILERIAAGVAEVIGPEVALHIEAVDEIPPDGSGKVRQFRSIVGRERAASALRDEMRPARRVPGG